MVVVSDERLRGTFPCRIRRRRWCPMIGRLLKTAMVVGVATLVVQALPDIARYLRIREM
jgi:hypothetical protein